MQKFCDRFGGFILNSSTFATFHMQGCMVSVSSVLYGRTSLPLNANSYTSFQFLKFTPTSGDAIIYFFNKDRACTS